MANDPITREEMLLNAVVTGVSSGIEPITREEKYLAYIGGQDVVPPEPITRKEQFLSMISPGGGSGVVIRNQDKLVTENGTYKADSGYTGLGSVTVAVPIPEVEEPVLETLNVTENGEYTPAEGVDGFSRVSVNVAGSGGGKDLLAAYMNRTLTEYSSEEVTNIPDYMFYSVLVTNLNLPNVTKIGYQAFYYNTITSINFPKLIEIGGGAFERTGKLISYYAPLVATIGKSAFNFSGIPNADFPEAITVGDRAFQGTPITYVNLPKITSLGSSAFNSCKKLTNIDLPSGVAMLKDQLFRACTALTTVILRSPTVVNMQYQSVFQETSFYSGGTGGTVYVPSALIEDYKVATNWSALYKAGSLTFATIEGSEYE